MENKTVTLSYQEHERLLKIASTHDAMVMELKREHKLQIETICEGGGVKRILPGMWSGSSVETIVFTKADVRQQLDAGLEDVAKYKVALDKLFSRKLFARIMNKMPEGMYIE